MRHCLNPKTSPSGSLESNILIRNIVLWPCVSTEKRGRKFGEEQPLIWFHTRGITVIIPLRLLHHLRMGNDFIAGLAQPASTVLIWKERSFGAEILAGRK